MGFTAYANGWVMIKTGKTTKRAVKLKIPPPPARAEFARCLKMARKKKYASGAAGARALGVEAETYRRWERAETEPDITDLGKICQEFDCSADFLINDAIPTFRKK